jgi:hypothetical protein
MAAKEANHEIRLEQVRAPVPTLLNASVSSTGKILI